MKSLLSPITNFVKNLKYEHDESIENDLNNFITYETLDDAYIIATSDEYFTGKYINEHNPEEFFYKEMMDDGMYAIGFDIKDDQVGNVYVSTNDGGMIRDTETRVSSHPVEIFFANIASLGDTPFTLLRVETDNKINVIFWYRRGTEAPVEKSKRGRKKKNVQ